MCYVHIDGAGLTVEVEAPGFLQDLFAAQDKSAVLGKGKEEIEFLGTQVKALRSKANFAAGGVNRHVTEMDRRRGVRVAAGTSKNRVDTGDQFARVERFGQVVIRTQFETQDLVDILITSSEHENGGCIVHSTQTTTDFEAIQ